MKIRKCFVSNSSSSSFIVIDVSKNYDETLKKFEGKFSFGEAGTTEFGWGPETVDDVYGRINFAYIQANFYQKDPTYLEMLESVIKENSKITEIDWKISDDSSIKDKVWGYIDHQSSGDSNGNLEMFENKETLKDFIFGKESCIEVDNDNG